MQSRSGLAEATVSMRAQRLFATADVAGIDREGAISRKKNHQKADQTYEIEVVEVTRLVQQKNICKPEKENRRGDPVQESEHDAGRGHTKHGEVDIHPIARPWFHPFESEVAKIKGRIDVVAANPSGREVTVDFP